MNAGLVVTFGILGCMGWLSYRNMAALIEDDRRGIQVFLVKEELGGLLSAMKDVETGQRGFVMTGKEEDLEPYREALEQVATHLKTLRSLTRDSPRQPHWLTALEPLIQAKLALAKENIELRPTQGFEAAQRNMQSGMGKQLMDEIRRQAKQAQADEGRRLEERSALKAADLHKTIWSLGLGGFVACMILLSIFVLLKQEIGRRLGIEKELTKHRERLENIVRERTTALEQEIAEHQRAEEALRASEELFRVIASNTPDHILLQDRALRYLFVVNPQLGLTEADMIGKTDHDFLSKEDADTLTAIKRKVLETGEPLHQEIPLVSRTGKKEFFDGSYIPRLNAEGQVDGLIGYFQNVTAQREAKEQLHKSQKLLQDIIDNAESLIYLVDLEGRYLMLNRPMEDLFGISREHLIGKDRLMVLPKEIAEQHRANDLAVIREKSPLTFEEATEEADGRHTYLSVKFPLMNADGEVYAVGGISTDITERKRAEMELEQSRRRFQELSEATFEGIVISEQGRIIDVNEQLAQMLDIPQEELIGKNFMTLIVPEDRERIMANIHAGREAITEHGLIRRDGTIIIVEAHGKPSGFQGRQTRITAIHDITERKRAEASLQASEARFRMIFEYAPVMINSFDQDGRCVLWNSQCQRVFGWTAEELNATENPLALFYPDPEVRQQVLDSILSKPEKVFREWHPTSKDGTERICRWANFVLPDGTVISLGMDITEAKRSENALRKANERLAEADRRKDEFLAMLAHELRNPLAPIRNAAQILGIVGADEQSLQRQRGIIDRQVAHMAHLLDDLLDVSRITRGKIVLQKRALHLTDVLAHALETAAPLIEGRHHLLELSMPPDSLCVEGDIDRLAQAVGNLLANAAKYTDEEGKILLEGKAEDGQAVVRVRDNGVGIAPQTLPHIFELFIQADQGLDRAQGGLGIGLTMVKSLVESHGGTVEAYSAGLGLGSEFTIRLPTLPSIVQVPAPLENPKSCPPEAAPRRILIVDDIVDTSTSLAELLKIWGHEVRMDHNGPAALDTAQAWRPDVVLLDIGLPGMNGFEVARRLRAEHGNTMRLIAMTGYVQDSDRQKAREAGFDEHLAKPVDLIFLQELLKCPVTRS